jgi:hypothetical protein
MVPFVASAHTPSLPHLSCGVFTQQYLRKAGRLLRYDYGTNCSDTGPFKETCNQQKYGSLVPPEYDLGRINTPMVSPGLCRRFCLGVHGEAKVVECMQDAWSSRAAGVPQGGYIYCIVQCSASMPQ